MARTKDWTRFGFLVGLTILLAVGFATAIDFPRPGFAQPPAPVFDSATRPQIPAAQSAVELGDAFTAVSEVVRPSVVFIRTTQFQQNSGRSTPLDPFFQNAPDPRPRTGQGSGFIISTNGYIITNNHVVENADRLEVSLLDGHRYEADIIGRDPLTDIAVIKIDGEGFPAVALGNSDETRIGEWVLAIGNPLGEAFSFTVTAGIVSGRGRRLDNLRPQDQNQSNYSIHDFIQTDAAINPGNSGGPLVNIRGEVIGVNSAIASQTGFYSGYGFAVPIELARRVSEQLIANGEVTRSVLGVSINEATAEDAEYVGLESVYGVIVQSFSEDSPAEAAGMRMGDVIIAVDDKPARYVAQLQQEIGFRTPGESVKVTVARRGGTREDLTVRLKAADTRPEAPTEVVTRRPEPREPASESRLGVTLEEFNGSDVDPRLTGLRILGVDPRGPGAQRIFQNEIITHVEGQRVRNLQELGDALDRVTPGQVVELRTSRPNEGGVALRTLRMRIGTQ